MYYIKDGVRRLIYFLGSKSCFGKGHWENNLPWDNNDGWKN